MTRRPCLFAKRIRFFGIILALIRDHLVILGMILLVVAQILQLVVQILLVVLATFLPALVYLSIASISVIARVSCDLIGPVKLR